MTADELLKLDQIRTAILALKDTPMGHQADVSRYLAPTLELAERMGINLPVTTDVHFTWLPISILMLKRLEELEKRVDSLTPKVKKRVRKPKVVKNDPTPEPSDEMRAVPEVPES